MSSESLRLHLHLSGVQHTLLSPAHEGLRVTATADAGAAWGGGGFDIEGSNDQTAWSTVKAYTVDVTNDEITSSFLFLRVSGTGAGATGVNATVVVEYLDVDPNELTNLDEPIDVVVTSVTPVPLDFYLEVAKGNVPGHSLVHKFGRNDACAAGVWERIDLLSGAATFLSAPTTVRLAAGGHANDTAAGSAAQEVYVQGIDSNLAEVIEVIATNGAAASAATTASFWRVHRMWVGNVGAYGGVNTNAAVCENSGGGTSLCSIGAGEGQSQFAQWTVPLGKSAYLLSVLTTVDASKSSDIKMMTRENFNDVTTPFTSLRLKNYFDGLTSPLGLKPHSPIRMFPALTDIWMEAQGPVGGSEVSADFELLVVEDGF